MPAFNFFTSALMHSIYILHLLLLNFNVETLPTKELNNLEETQLDLFIDDIFFNLKFKTTKTLAKYD